ncbi:MarR family winged helix-turn-helix transcriptional regulator [Streptomyces coeruleoprunus]|uniref:MarR family winged helix-turn-helix transcriptional regulator n=1 Tax=Streptomyces coeruleoprunus TaxID=285563 RepID=A0ABV9XFI1_9ACTN
MSRTTPTLSPADPGATDDELAGQPIGYWSGAAHRAVIGYIRDAMARIDVTQPQWWTLNRVDVDGPGPTREDVAAAIGELAGGDHEVFRVVDQLLHRGWLSAGDDGRLRLTDTGRTAKARVKNLVTDLRTQVHEGVPDEEYVAALKVLRRMIRNVEDATRDASQVRQRSL